MNIRKYGRRLLLPLAAPLLFASYGALAAVGGSATPFFPAGTLTVGEGPLDARIELVGTGDDFPATVDAGTIKLTISCGTNADPWNCPAVSVETGVLSIEDTTAVAGGSLDVNEICNSVTFDFGAPDATTGEILITPSEVLTFPSSGDKCTINLQVNVDALPANDASGATGLQTAQGAEFRLHNDVNDEGSGTGADTTTIAACSVQVDKQVSCDGGTTWVDQGYNDSATGTCNGLEDDLINIRYLARNTGTGCELTNCVLTETNPVFDTSPGSSFGLLDGVETDPATENTPQDCSDAFGIPGEDEHEPDTVSVICDTPFGGTVTDEDTASFACLTVDLLVDRNVDCDGAAGDDPADMTLTRDDGDGQLGCTANDGDPITWGYRYCNNGTATLYDCRLTDDNTDVSVPIEVGTLAPDTCATPSTGNPTLDPLDCSTQLESDELANGQINLACCTRDVTTLEDCAEADRVAVFDRSTVECQTQSGLEITKECLDDDGDGSDDTARVTVAATAGDLGFENCVPTDAIYLDNPTCSENPPGTIEGTPTEVALTPAGPYTLAPEGEQVSEGTFALNDADACNTASVTCDPLSGGEPVTEDAAPVICDFQEEGCITRTPGYWGTHPTAAAALLDVEVCGQTLASVEPNAVSTTEAMCSVGKDGKKLGSQVTQLIRQCTAAALNHAVSAAEEGGCTHAQEETFAECCGAATGEGNSCSAQDEGGLSVSACIGLLDEFNNSRDTQQTDWFDDYNPADSSLCRESKNNGYHPYYGL